MAPFQRGITLVKRKTAAEVVKQIVDQSVIDQVSVDRDKMSARIRRLEVELSDSKASAKRALDQMNNLQDRVELAEATYSPARAYQIGESKQSGKSTSTAMLLLSDLHLEERVDPQVCMGFEYNLQIARRRFDRVINTSIDVLDNQRRFFPWRDLVIWIGGDIISGAIHDELEAQNFLGPTDAIIFAQDMLLAGLDKVRSELKPRKITIVCNMGNHGRSTPKKRHADGYQHSWEWLAYHNLARVFQKDKTIEWMIAKGPLVEVQIEGTPVRFTHGDDLSFMGGVGGVFIPLAKKIAAWDRRWKATKTILGHYHQHFHISNAIMNGCLIGPNAYSIAGGFAAETPSQTTAIVDSQRGFVDVTQIFAE